MSTLTKTESEAASYEFTTLTCIPGVIDYKGANIQLLDLPGIIEGAAQGKGRGKLEIKVLNIYLFSYTDLFKIIEQVLKKHMCMRVSFFILKKQLQT